MLTNGKLHETEHKFLKHQALAGLGSHIHRQCQQRGVFTESIRDGRVMADMGSLI